MSNRYYWAKPKGKGRFLSRGSQLFLGEKMPDGLTVSSLKPGMRRVDIEGKIGEISVRDVQTKYGPGQVGTTDFSDSTGSVKLVIWNENISKIAEGNTVFVENGYVDSFRGEVHVNVGRYGKITVIE